MRIFILTILFCLQSLAEGLPTAADYVESRPEIFQPDRPEVLSDRQSLLASTPNIKPARGPIGSRFGYRIDPINGRQKMHAGVDMSVPPGTPVRAPADGVVSFAGWDEMYGKLVSIDHGYGVLTRFAHNSQIYVQVGQKVSKYDVISASGSTGRSTGPHLHYEVRVNGVPVNPMNYILDDE